MFQRGRGRRGVGRLEGAACARMVEGIMEAPRRKYKWGFLQTGHVWKPRESKKFWHGVQV